METVEFNWHRTIKIWWYWFWRATLFTVIVSFLVGMLLGAMLAITGASDNTLKLVGNITGIFIGIFFALIILKSLPEKEFSDFKVVLVKHDSGSGDGGAQRNAILERKETEN